MNTGAAATGESAGRDREAHADATVVIVFTPSGRRGSVPVGTTVLDAARRLGVDLDSVCGGRALCGRCMVTPAFGEFTKHAIVSEPGTSVR